MGETLDSFGPIGQYLPLFILGVVAIGLGILLVNLSKLMGPFRPNKVKESVYESGMDPVGTAHDRMSVKFYMVAMLFILFDIEVVFMYPWAVNYAQLMGADMQPGTSGTGLFPLIEMFVFVVILFVGYIYVWKKGGLEWD
jgi:NADH-quinone oxidoreductase subunit A